MSFKVFFTGSLNKKTNPKNNFIVEQFYIDKHNFDKKINFIPINLSYSSKEFRKNYKFINKKKHLYKNDINKFLKKNFPEKRNYWEKSVDYWLIHFLSTVHIKYQKLKKIKRKYPNIKVFKVDPKYLHNIYQTSDFLELVEYSESLNVFIYQKIAEVLNIKLIDSNFKSSSIPKLLKDRNNKKKIQHKRYFIRKIKFLFIYLYCIIRRPYLLIDIYSSRKFKIKCLLFSFGKLLPISSESIYLDEKINFKKKVLNSQSIHINEVDEFDSIINNIINYCFPRILLINFNLKKFNFLKRVKGIVSSINITSQDYFRFVISLLDKKKVYSLQHGGLYNMQKKNLIEDFEKKNSIFLGWDKPFSLRAYFDHKFSNKLFYKKNKNIILFTTIKNINMVRYESETTEFKSNNDLLINNFNFYQNLSNKIKNHLTVRIPKHNYDWNLEKLWKKKSLNFSGKLKVPNFFNLDSPETAISNSRIFVCDHISTAFFEALYSGIPVIIFDDLKKYEFKNKTLKLLLDLKKNNVIHDSPEGCAAFINTNYHDIDKWWNDKKTKKAINSLKKNIFANNYKFNIPGF